MDVQLFFQMTTDSLEILFKIFRFLDLIFLWIFQLTSDREATHTNAIVAEEI